MSDGKRAPTREEIEAEIKTAGLSTGKWSEMGGKDADPLMLGEQVRLAQQLKGILEEEEKLLQSELKQAKEALHRLKHGGGA